VTLTLEIITAPSSMPSARVRTFGEDGGVIGRDKAADWVLPDAKVSARHAVISCRNGVFYIEDRSRNGVFLNSTTNRLTALRPQALASGDCLYIEPYEIQVSISEDSDDRLFGALREDAASRALAPGGVSPLLGSPEPVAEPEGFDVVDPLALLGGGVETPRSAGPLPSARAVTADELERRGGLQGQYTPPRIVPPPDAPKPVVDPVARSSEPIPSWYDPLKDNSVLMPAAPPRVAAPPLAPPQAASSAPPPVAQAASASENIFVAPPPAPVVRPRPAPGASSGAVPVAKPKARPAPPVEAATPTPPERSESDLARALAGAGLSDVPVTPELAENFGRILRVVVGGVMDLLRARQQIKDELRMHLTQFQPADNNPLKFSANVEDALHNLLIKRNAAYLAPVDAFTDAFEDLRDHQLAMLAGLRVAFEAMLADFEAERLEQKFERQLKKGALLSMPAKMRYWDSYRDMTRQMIEDAEGTFRKWFGEEFVKAYEEQLKRLETERRARSS
jgi:type VI secretion system FHA domain protein